MEILTKKLTIQQALDIHRNKLGLIPILRPDEDDVEKKNGDKSYGNIIFGNGLQTPDFPGVQQK